MKSITGEITSILAEHGVIKHDDIDRCQYGLYIFLTSIFILATILIVSAFVGNFLLTLIFFAAFIPIRMYSGGYHADTKLMCFIISMSVYIAFTVFFRYLYTDGFSLGIIIGIIVFSSITIFIYSPIIHKNKNVNDNELKVYRKVSIAIMFVEIIIIVLLFIVFVNKQYAVSAALGQFAETLSIVAAKIKEKIIDNK